MKGELHPTKNRLGTDLVTLEEGRVDYCRAVSTSEAPTINNIQGSIPTNKKKSQKRQQQQKTDVVTNRYVLQSCFKYARREFDHFN